MIKAYLFDLDDTLLDREKSIEPFIRHQYDRIAIGHVPFQKYEQRFVELDNHGYCDKNELYQNMITEFYIPESAEALEFDFWDNAWKNCQLFPRVKEVLKELRRSGYKLGIVTNGLEKSQNTKVNSSGIEGLVDDILISEVEKIDKPDVEIFKRAARKMNVKSSECVFIGDNPYTDIEGARNAGMKTVWIRRHFSWPNSFSYQPDITIKNIDEILGIAI